MMGRKMNMPVIPNRASPIQHAIIEAAAEPQPFRDGGMNGCVMGGAASAQGAGSPCDPVGSRVRSTDCRPLAQPMKFANGTPK